MSIFTFFGLYLQIEWFIFFSVQHIHLTTILICHLYIGLISRGLCRVPRLQLVEEFLPTGHRLVGPDPEAGRYAYDQSHEVFQHEHLELRLAADMASLVPHGARDRVHIPDAPVRGHWTRMGRASTAHVHMPGQHPVVNVHELIQVAHDDQHGRDSIQDAEDAYPDHQLLQLVRLGAIVLHDGADATERDETGEEEHKTQDEIDTEGDDDKVPQSLSIPDTHVADSGQDVTCEHKRTGR